MGVTNRDFEQSLALYPRQKLEVGSRLSTYPALVPCFRVGYRVKADSWFSAGYLAEAYALAADEFPRCTRSASSRYSIRRVG